MFIELLRQRERERQREADRQTDSEQGIRETWEIIKVKHMF